MTTEGHIAPLARRHKDLERQIDDELGHLAHDDLMIAALKRKNLEIKDELKKLQRDAQCNRCILVGHNANFDLQFLKAAVDRQNLKNSNPFHPFSVFDTVTLAGVVYGQTVLAKACFSAGMEFSNEEAHSALYDA